MPASVQGYEIAEQMDDALLSQLGVVINNVVSDSRVVKPGDTFLAFPGEQGDGRKHIDQAIANGANAVIWESDGFERADWSVPNLGVPALRDAAGVIASKVYGDPSSKLWVIGVTGTNGKTSCANWLAKCLSAQGRKTAVIGTLGNGFYGELSPATNTTPDPVSLQNMMKGFHDEGAQCVAMEVSSHGLHQGRVNGVAFDVALLTNLSRDHLDYHGDMETYAQVKARLFTWKGLKSAVLNMDDPFGVKLANTLDKKQVNVVGYGVGRGDVSGSNLRLDQDGLMLDVHTPWGSGQIKSQMLGAFNASNLLGVLSTLLVSGMDLEVALGEVSSVLPASGRMQRVGGGDKPLVIVDYAHTPDALEKVLLTLKELLAASVSQQGKLICVFGCGGDRDKGKRPLMGEIATRLADWVIVTSDNPRKENARGIIEEIVKVANANYLIEEDRTMAIMRAIKEAEAGDVVLIAGKGHEEYQEIKGVKLPFSDVEVANRVLQNELH
nr:UDP-N-acetylmuramoyl-L-alanyl-D-glutamate--2,6-diaminopimelate ligase [Sulfurirhabdus autotrophica]